MIHRMGLYGEYFSSIRNGQKTVEVRLNDEKRRRIKVGDRIEFVQVAEQEDVLHVTVTALQSFATFAEMYRAIPFEAMDCVGWSMEEMIAGTYEIYRPEQEKAWGTLAITIACVNEAK